MKKTTKIFTSILLFTVILAGKLSASTFFSGYTGAKINYSGNKDSIIYDPDLKLQAFFAGQFNFTNNIWAHAEFSLDTGDFISENIFHETSSKFRIDEISLIFRGNFTGISNYFSVFLGTYDPVGSDIFLQRYFNLPSIESKLTDSWLGLAGSVIYPQRGFGLADVIVSNNIPFAAGIYAYLNHEDSKYFVFNGDLRAAACFNYFVFDLACGLGAPLTDKYQGNDVILAVEKLYWHAGTTVLLGNNYTQSLFLQAGVFNASFTNLSNISMSKNSVYLLFEPRFRTQNLHINVTAYNLPQDTVDNSPLIDDPLGIDLNIYTDYLRIGSKTFTLGGHTSFSMVNKTIFDLGSLSNLNKNDLGINIAGYTSTDFLSGELHLMIKLRITDFINDKWYNAFSVDLGFRSKL